MKVVTGGDGSGGMWGQGYICTLRLPQVLRGIYRMHLETDHGFVMSTYMYSMYCSNGNPYITISNTHVK